MIRHRDPSLLGALASWGFDIATLWASFEAFGHSPPVAVLVIPTDEELEMATQAAALVSR